jgi:orotate phosphoribosyltransferase
MYSKARAGVESDLAKRVAALCHLEGEFVLRSGQAATTYFDKYLLEADPEVLWECHRAARCLVSVVTKTR